MFDVFRIILTAYICVSIQMLRNVQLDDHVTCPAFIELCAKDISQLTSGIHNFFNYHHPRKAQREERERGKRGRNGDKKSCMLIKP